MKAKPPENKRFKWFHIFQRCHDTQHDDIRCWILSCWVP